MPMRFFNDTDTNTSQPDSTRCLDEVEMWDGPATCTRIKDHKENKDLESPELCQEPFEGWVWDGKGIR